MTPNLIINFVLFQTLWFACVLGAGSFDHHWLAVAAISVLTAHILCTATRWTDITCGCVAVLLGYTLDNIWVFSGILNYPEHAYAPYWLALLWLGFGMSLSHSMSFFRDAGWLGAVIVGVFGPVTYLTGERFGAVMVPELWQTIWITISWIALFRILSFYSTKHLRQNSRMTAEV